MAPQIFLGAAKAFADLGYEATRVEDILAASRVSRRTFYKLFRSKEAVFEALFAYGGAAVDSAMVMATAQAGSERSRRIEAAVAALFESLDDFGPVCAAMLIEARKPESHFAPLRERVFRRFEQLLQAELQAAAIETDLLLVRALIAAVEDIAINLLRQSPRGQLDHARAQAVVLRLITASLLAPASSVVHRLPRPYAPEHG